MKNIFYGWWIVFACFVIAFYISGAVTIGFTAFFEPIVKEFGWSYTQVSFAASLRGLELGIFSPLMGFLVDRFGARSLLFSGTVAIGTGFILLSQTHSLSMFYGAFVLVGLGTSACTGTVLTPAVANWFRKDLGKALGIMASGFGLGGLLIPVINWLIHLYQWRTTFVILAFIIWLLGIPLSFVIRQTPEQYGYLPDGETPEEARTTRKSIDKNVGFKSAIRTRVFWYISLAEAIRLMALTAVITHVMPYLVSIGMSRSGAALVTTSIPLASIFGRLVFGWLGDNYNKWRVLAAVYFFTGIGLVFFAYAQSFWTVFFFLIFYPLTWGAGPVRGAIMRESFGRASLGTIFGIMAGVGTLARIVGPSLAGLIYDKLGYYQPIWLLFAGTLTIPIILALTFKPRESIPLMNV